MKRVLQGLALLQILLVIGIGARIVQVWSTPLPEFGDIPELPAPTPLPPPKPVAKVSEATTDAVVEHDLFDDQRGQNKVEDVAGITIDAAPVPPPSNVQLMGVMQLGTDPVAIVLDTSVNPEQKAVRKGDMFGEYQVGEITTAGHLPGMILLGTAGQQFQIPLKVGAAGGGGAGVAPPAPGAAATRPPGGKPVQAKPVPPQRADGQQHDDGGDQKAMNARERAQAIAQRNADLRKGGNQKGGAAGGDKDGKADPVQARLEALRQLREAAKSR